MADRAGSSSNSDLSALFQELEQREAVLKSKPEVIHKLLEFDAASQPSNDAKLKKQAKGPRSCLRGPSL
ncbi:hypothetical protein GCM10007927_07420 [Sulfitobacter pacificus]|uniref:Uncharacterized protein n=1 Tax=Sulfitobacter pacificus TaxID=1499314 RepID=A0ABQ5VEK0_9RHOB|nr:hypothetical protein GCM10007927_07420 [Sulfitobacter pacificus]